MQSRVSTKGIAEMNLLCREASARPGATVAFVWRQDIGKRRPAPTSRAEELLGAFFYLPPSCAIAPSFPLSRPHVLALILYLLNRMLSYPACLPAYLSVCLLCFPFYFCVSLFECGFRLCVGVCAGCLGFCVCVCLCVYAYLFTPKILI